MQESLFNDNAEYDAFVNKFKSKKTTDDCYTPPLVYDAVADWVQAEYGIARAAFVRPFYPGGDYETFDYLDGCAVVDNPPFSLLSRIIRFYCQRNIRFFLFGPTLTLFTATECDVTYIPCSNAVIYENGANVNTSFVTNLDAARVRTAPELYKAVDAANDANQALQKAAPLPKYVYPDEVITAAMVARWCKYGLDFRVEKDEARYIGALDAQKAYRKSIFGGGYLLSERAAVERAAVERVAAKVWELSERERRIVAALSSKAGRAAHPTGNGQIDLFIGERSDAN